MLWDLKSGFPRLRLVDGPMVSLRVGAIAHASRKDCWDLLYVALYVNDVIFTPRDLCPLSSGPQEKQSQPSFNATTQYINNENFLEPTIDDMWW